MATAKGTAPPDRVILRHKWMDVKRIVYLNQREHPKGGVRTSLGHSIGPFEGDTLVIETGNYSAGVLNQYVSTVRPQNRAFQLLTRRRERHDKEIGNAAALPGGGAPSTSVPFAQGDSVGTVYSM